MDLGTAQRVDIVEGEDRILGSREGLVLGDVEEHLGRRLCIRCQHGYDMTGAAEMIGELPEELGKECAGLLHGSL
jgi:hypothetical protein